MKYSIFLALFSYAVVMTSCFANFFESDGRLPQVELAIKACKKGSPLFAAVANDGIAVCYLGEDHDEWTLDRKVSQLADSLYISGVGIASDVSFMVQQSQSMVMVSESSFGQSSSLSRLSRRLASFVHGRSLRSDERPLGVSLLVFGEDNNIVDGGFQLKEIDTLGNLFDCQMTCIGRDSQSIIDHWDESIDVSSLTVQELAQEMTACMKVSLAESDYPELCSQIQSVIYQGKELSLLPNHGVP